MGLVNAEIELANPRYQEGEKRLSMTISALVDTGALHLCIPQRVAVQLDLREVSKREVTTADGKVHLAPYVGPVSVSFSGRVCLTGALVLGDSEVLLGAIPMEDMDLVVQPATQTLMVNPASPNIPASIAK